MPARVRKGETEVPSTIERSDARAQRIWRRAHESAVKTYGEGRSAHRVAYAALKHEYEKRGNRWVAKGWKGPSDPQARRGPTTRPKSTDEPRAPTAGGKVARGKPKGRGKGRSATGASAKGRRRATGRS